MQHLIFRRPAVTGTYPGNPINCALAKAPYPKTPAIRLMKKICLLFLLASLSSLSARAEQPTMTIYGTFDPQAPKGQAPILEIKPTESSISLYGTIDAGVRHVTNAASNGGSLLSMSSNGNYYNNRFGIKGTEDIGGGMNAHFHLEAGFNSGTGELDNTQNRLFNRISSVGIAGTFGSLDFGRQPSVACKVVHAYDPFSYRYVQLIPLAGAVAGHADPDNPFGKLGGTRFSNAAQYIGKFGNLSVLGEYVFGEVSGSSEANSAKALGIVYRPGPYAFGIAYTRQQPNVANSGTPDYADQDQLTFGAAYKSGAWRIAGGHIGANSETTRPGTMRRARNNWFGGSYDITSAIGITAALYKTSLGSASGATARRDLFILGATYALSTRTNLYADVDRAKTTGFASATPGRPNHQTGISLGINHMF